MKKRIMIAALFVLTTGVSAQTIYEGAKITNKDLNGTARFVGMGGALGALGGDLSTIGTNPAGIGIYRSNDMMTSFGLSSYGVESQYQGVKSNSDKIRGSFDNIGFVFSTKIGNETPLRYVNFGFNYKRAKSFNKNTNMNGSIGNFSQTFLMSSLAGGIDNWKNAYTSDIGWLSALGYDGWLITDVTTKVTEKPYLDKDGKPLFDYKGKPLYTTPGSYTGMYNNAYAQYRSEERGGIDQYDFNMAFNLSDRVYLGITVGAYSIDYNNYSFYDEDYGSNEGYSLQSWNKLKGSGFDIKLGTIIRPFADSPFRIGLALHTPTFYQLDYTTSAVIDSQVLNELTGKVDSHSLDTRDMLDGDDMVREFEFRTPWTYNVSLGYTVGKTLALGAEYEYQDYASMKFNYPEGDQMTYETSTAQNMLKGVHTFRVGAEYKVIPQFAFRLGYNHATSAFGKNAHNALDLNSLQTNTGFANSQSLNNYTLGIGYRGSIFYADLAYKYSTYKEDFYPFYNEYHDGKQWSWDVPEATKITNTRSQVLLTLGVHF